MINSLTQKVRQLELKLKSEADIQEKEVIKNNKKVEELEMKLKLKAVNQEEQMTKECSICFDELEENWGLVHATNYSIHAGYCRKCAVMIYKDRNRPDQNGCPQCRRPINNFIKIFI